MAKVESESAFSLKLRRDPHYSNEHSQKCLVTRPSIQRAPCWSIHDKTEMIDTAARGWTCPPIYMIARSSCVDKCSEGEDHIFDGAHKVETLFDFMDDKFALKYTDLSTAFLAEYNGKKFSELPLTVRNTIKTYKFNINMIDEETASDPDLLKVLWIRVNRAGKRLNDYEINIPVIAPLLTRVINPCMAEFFETPLFPKDATNRGDLEHTLLKLLAIADYNATSKQSGNSLSGLVSVWYVKSLGSTMKEREDNVTANCETWCATLTRCLKIMKDLEQLNTFCTEDGTSIMEESQRTELLLFLGRAAACFPKIEDFRSRKRPISTALKTVFLKPCMELVTELGCKSRNWTFHRKIIRLCDSILTETTVQPRLFTREQKEAKLAEQNGLCAMCHKKILAHQLMDGDHIVEWCEGGDTTMANLQILHRMCHMLKQ